MVEGFWNVCVAENLGFSRKHQRKQDKEDNQTENESTPASVLRKVTQLLLAHAFVTPA
jgi:hypothetical protein